MECGAEGGRHQVIGRIAQHPITKQVSPLSIHADSIAPPTQPPNPGAHQTPWQYSPRRGSQKIARGVSPGFGSTSRSEPRQGRHRGRRNAAPTGLDRTAPANPRTGVPGFVSRVGWLTSSVPGSRPAKLKCAGCRSGSLLLRNL